MADDGDLTLITHDTSTWTRDDTAAFMSQMKRWMAWEYRGNPGPLCIDGREYHRRQKARKKRGR